MRTSDAVCNRSALTLNLEAALRAKLESLAAEQLLSLDDYVTGLLQQILLNEAPKPPRKAKHAGSKDYRLAPMDAFLPAGVDPFSSAGADSVLASSFEDIQARLRFSGTPSLLRNFVD